MKKLIHLFLILLFFSSCKSKNFYGIYQNKYHETWNLYKENDKILLSFYSYQTTKDKPIEVDLYDKDNLKKQILLMPKNGEDYIVLSKHSNIWYLEIIKNNLNSILKKEFKKISGNLSDEELQKLKYSSELLSETIANNEGYHYSNNNKIYYIYAEYPKIHLIEYIYNDNYYIVSEKKGEIYLDNQTLLFQIDNKVKDFNEFKNQTVRLNNANKNLFKMGSKIFDAVYVFSRMDIVKDFGLSENETNSLKNSKILISPSNTLLINSNNNAILDSIPRHGGGVQGENGISIYTTIENEIFPDEIKVNIFNEYNKIVDLENNVFTPLYNYEINVYFRLEQ